MCPTLSRRARSSGGVFDAAAHSDVGAAGIDGASLARSLDFFVLGSVSGDAESFSPIGDARFIGDSTTCVPPMKSASISSSACVPTTGSSSSSKSSNACVPPAKSSSPSVTRPSSSALAPAVDFLILVASAASAARELTEHITHHRARLFRARPARGRALTSIVRRRLPPVGRVLHLRQRVVQIILRKRLRRRLARARRAFEPKRVQPDLRARALHPRAHVREDSFALVVVVVVFVVVVVVSSSLDLDADADASPLASAPSRAPSRSPRARPPASPSPRRRRPRAARPAHAPIANRSVALTHARTAARASPLDAASACARASSRDAAIARAIASRDGATRASASAGAVSDRPHATNSHT